MTDKSGATNGSASFRFLRLTEAQANDLRITFPEAEFGQHYKTGEHIGTIPLHSSNVVIKIDEFRRSHKIRATDCDLFVSIFSVRGDEIWRAPKTVNYLVNIVNCPIVFSFSSCASDKGNIVGEESE